MSVNMQYCQFENTLAALKELDFSDSHFKTLSPKEKEARFDLIYLMMDVVDPFAEQEFEVEGLD